MMIKIQIMIQMLFHGEKEVIIHLLIIMSKIIYYINNLENQFIRKIIKILKEIDLILIMHQVDLIIIIEFHKKKIKKVK